MSNPHDLSRSARRVEAVLTDRGFTFRVVELPDSTRTARDASTAIGCAEAPIAKSLVFRGRHTNQPIRAIASGPNRVDEARLGAWAGKPIDQASPDFVRDHTGFAIGGVPPVGRAAPLTTWIDEDLMQHDVMWAAAGTPRAVFDLDPMTLPDLTNGTVTHLKE